MIKEVSLHMAFFCISVCISVPPQSTDNQFMWHLVGILYFLSQLCLKKKKNQLSLLSSIHSDILSIYMCWHAVCVCVGLIVMSISWDNVTAVRGLNKKNELLAPVIP